jgi:hypothetical protein
MGRSTPGAAEGAAAATALTGIMNDRFYTELMECCCVAVLDLGVAAGQGSEPGVVCGLGDPGMAVALDDVAVAWGIVAHDEGLQLVRWSPWRWIVLQQVEEGELGLARGLGWKHEIVASEGLLA